MEVDRSPFAPKIHVMYMYTYPLHDCCSYQALSYDEEECIWKVGAIIHNYIGSDIPNLCSPLFSITHCNEKLNDTERFFVKLSEYLKNVDDTIRKKTNEYIDTHPMTTEEITDWVNNGCKLK